MKRFTWMVVAVLVVSLIGGAMAWAAPEARRPLTKPGTMQEVTEPDNPEEEETVTPESETPEPEPTDVDEPDIEETVTPEPSVTPEPIHPVANAIAAFFGVPYDEVESLHDAGYGFGQIARAYFLAEILGKTPQEILAARDTEDMDWGQLLKLLKADPRGLKHTNLGVIMGHKKPKETPTGEPGLSPTQEPGGEHEGDEHDGKAGKHDNDRGPKGNQGSNDAGEKHGGSNGDHGGGKKK